MATENGLKQPKKTKKVSHSSVNKHLSSITVFAGEDEELVVFAYKSNAVRAVLSWLLYVLTLGFARIVFHWKPEWMVLIRYGICAMKDAEVVLIRNQHRECFVRKVKVANCSDFTWNPSYEDVNSTEEEHQFQSLLALTNSEPIMHGFTTKSSSNNNSSKFSYSFPGNGVRRSRTTPKSIPLNNFQLPTDEDGQFATVTSYRYFTHQKVKYIWRDQPGTIGGGVFKQVSSLDVNVCCSYFHQCRGISRHESARRRGLKPIWSLLFREVLNPFYIFQVFSVTVWYFDDYIYFASCIVFISILSIILDVYQTRRNQKALRDTVHSSDIVTVVRPSFSPFSEAKIEQMSVHQVQDFRKETLSSTELVPGDVIVIPPHGCVLHCDAVLIAGNCIVNESMLTGESVPVTKTPIPFHHVLSTSNLNSPGVFAENSAAFSASTETATEHRTRVRLPSGMCDAGGDTSPVMFNKREHAKHTLFCGTRVLQTRFYAGQDVKAVVVRTGFQTSKGQLVRSILYPKPIDFRFITDLLKFVGFLSIIAAVGFIYTIVIMSSRAINIAKIVRRSLDVITIVVPPALPAAMTVGIIAARQRLKRLNIFCISPSIINTCGAIDCVCFDKTGTLTEDGLDFLCVVSVDDGLFSKEIKSLDEIAETPMIQALASCHSLTRIDGELSGDPMDLILYQATRWSLEEPKVDENAQYDQLAPTVVRPPKLRSPSGQSMSSIVAASRECVLVSSAGCSTTCDDQPLSGMPDTSELEIGILREFPFSSNLQRMSVIARRLGARELQLYCKGAPETIVSLCKPETVPSNFSSVLKQYTRNGYRVLGIAWRPDLQVNFVKAQRMQRQQAEKNLEFLGLAILENRLKRQTEPVIQQLKSAEIRCVMVTGDNVQTAISVARDCGLVAEDKKVFVVDVVEQPLPVGNDGGEASDENEVKAPACIAKLNLLPVEGCTKDDILHSPASCTESEEHTLCNGFELNGSTCAQVFQSDEAVTISVRSEHLSIREPRYALAITGTSYALLRKHFPHLLPQLAAVTSVFARMSPELKQLLVGDLQSLEYIVAMCGDGANDCGALKAAHAGISLSEAEASIASPFTSKNPNIECVPIIIREGRAALVTSFGVFKYMAGYSLAQFLSVCLLYWIASNIADFQFLYIDLFLITTFAMFFGYTQSSDVLVRRPPPSRILSLSSVLSIVVQILIVTFFQVFIYLYVTFQPWFIPFTNPGSENNFDSYQVTAVFLQSTFQYIALVIVYSKSVPYRKGIWTNSLLSLSLLVCTTCSVWITVNPPEFLADLLELKMPPPMEFRVLILFLAAINFILALMAEYLLIDWFLQTYCRKRGWYDAETVPEYRRLVSRFGGSLGWLMTTEMSCFSKSSQDSETAAV